MQNKKLATILILTATVLLAGVALFTAIKLYQIGQEDLTLKKEEKVLAPDSQKEIPFIAQQEGFGVCELVFNISEEPSPSPSEEPSPSPSDEPSPSPSEEPSPSPSKSPSPSEAPGPSPSPTTPPTGGIVPPASPTVYQQQTVPTQQLPEAGIISPTVIFFIGGIALLLLGILL